MPKPKRPTKTQQAESYTHPGAKSLMRPDEGTQGQFKKEKPPKIDRDDYSLSPAFGKPFLNWAGHTVGFGRGVYAVTTTVADIPSLVASAPNA